MVLKMGTARCAALGVLLAGALFAVTRANNNDNCLAARFEMEGCIDSARFNFKRLDRTSYNRKLCRGIKPMSECVTKNRQQCPNIITFQEESGQAVDSMMDTYSQVCLGAPGRPLQGGGRPGGAGQARCGGDRKKFRRRIGRCHRHLEVALKEDQMCEPMKKTIRCMRKQLNNHRACPWMRDAAARQIQFGIDYYAARRFIRYRCK